MLDFANSAPCLTLHACARAQQRNFRQREIDYVLAHGQLLQRTGLCFYFLGRSDVPADDRGQPWVERLIGTTLLVADSAVVTLYKNPRALRDIRKKAKYRRNAA